MRHIFLKRLAVSFSTFLVGVGLLTHCVPREAPVVEKKSAPSSRPARGKSPARGALGGDTATERDKPLVAVFTDDFERSELGSDWRSLSTGWTLENGHLCGQNAHNHPVWLRRQLPRNARIEFEARTDTEAGDLKAEFWGDGHSAAAGNSYTDATSYLAIFGGWNNRFHVLARQNEHAASRLESKLSPEAKLFVHQPVVPRRWYRFRLERSDGKTVRWSVDGNELFHFEDPNPLEGPGHRHFAFNDWQARVCFDKLKITPLPN